MLMCQNTRMKSYLSKLLPLFLLIVFLLPLTTQALVEIKNPLNVDTFEQLIYNIVNFLFWISLPVGALMIVFAAFYFLTSAGDPAKIKTAKDIIFWTIVGIIVLFLSVAILAAIKEMLEIKEGGGTLPNHVVE